MTMPHAVRKGFTLIEILVTVIVIGVLAAVVIPAVTRQATAGDSTRVASDLDFLRAGIETFSVNVRPKFPGDIEDLANAISSTDHSLNGAPYDATDIARWRGPYIEKSSAAGNALTSTPFAASGYSSFILQGLNRCSTTVLDGCAPLTSGEAFVAIVVSPLSPGQFEAINTIIDGDAETASSVAISGGSMNLPVGATTGRFRFALNGESFSSANSSSQATATSGTAYYLAVPYIAP